MVHSKRDRGDRDWIERIRRTLAEWYDAGHRELPWRRDRDPYRILVSEMMLVQTTVTAVVPYFERFLARFPSIEALATADEADVVKAWEGLGYYRRARQLRAAAREVMDRHQGVMPHDAEALLALPGIGKYIAGAILSFAFDRPAPIVEANTQRVLARLIAWKEDLKSSISQRRLWELAAQLVPEHGAGRFNQAVMELGAIVCTPREPACLICPVHRDCRAKALGLQDAVPVKTAKAPPKAVVERCAVVLREQRALIVQRAPGGLWEGFWEFPTLHISGADPSGRAFEGDVSLEEGVTRLTGVRARFGDEAKSIRFTVTNHRVELGVHWGAWVDGDPTPGPGLVDARWISLEDVSKYTLGSAMRRVAAWATAHTRSGT